MAGIARKLVFLGLGGPGSMDSSAWLSGARFLDQRIGSADRSFGRRAGGDREPKPPETHLVGSQGPELSHFPHKRPQGAFQALLVPWLI